MADNFKPRGNLGSLQESRSNTGLTRSQLEAMFSSRNKNVSISKKEMTPFEESVIANIEVLRAETKALRQEMKVISTYVDEMAQSLQLMGNGMIRLSDSILDGKQ